MGGASRKQQDSSHLPDVDVPYSENNYPPLKPPKTKKDIVYNPRLFTAIDAKASVTSRDDALSYQTLIKHLTEGLQNDVQKVRSIFVWLASQQIMYDNFDDVTDVNTPLGYMRLIQDDRGTYEQFFALLCRKAKIPCMVVQGNVKSATYEVGDMDIECIYGHWNLVYLDGSWRIVNPKWAMVSIGNYSNKRWRMIEKDGKAEQPDKEAGSLVYVYSQDDFYFLTDPEDHIYRCLPVNAKWQLLGEPWSMEKFLMVPLVHNDFFTSGLKLLEGQQGILVAKEGEVEINFQVTKGAKDIKYELYCDQKNKQKCHVDSQMSRYVFVNNFRSTRSFFIRLQTEGRYMLTILNDEDTPLCDFRIDCSGVKGTCEPFPKNPTIGWGFSETAKRAGLSSPSQESGIVTIDSKKSVDFTFKTQKGVDVKANLLHNEIPTTELEKHVNQQKDGDKLTVTVDIPTTSAKQEYALEINAKGSTTAKHQNVANYLLTTQKNKPHNIASRGMESTTNSGKHSNQTKTNGYIKKENPTEAPADKQNGTGQTRGMFSFLSNKPKTVPEETGGSNDKAANGSIPSKQCQTDNSDTKTDDTAIDKTKDTTKEPSQQSLTSKLKNKTYSFKIKNKETSGNGESCRVSPDGLPNGNQASESIHRLQGSRRESGTSMNANSLSPRRTPLHSPSPEMITDYSSPARIKRMKEAYLNNNLTKDTASYRYYARQKSSSPNPPNGDIPATDQRIKGAASPVGLATTGKLTPTQGNRSDMLKVPHPNTPVSGKGATTKPNRLQTGSTTLSSMQASTRASTVSNMSSDSPSNKIPTPSRMKGVSGFPASRTNSNNFKYLHQKTTDPTNVSKGSKTNEGQVQQHIEKIKDVQRIKQSLNVKETGSQKKGSGSKSPSRKQGGDRELICADLKKAIENRQLSEINKLLEETGVHSPDPRLTELKEKAETVRSVIKRMNKYLHEVMAVNQGTIAEIHSYSHPKPIVHDVMRATFLLLGERGSQLRKWHYIQQLMRRTSKDGLIVRIQEFDVSTISWELAEYVKLILDGHDPDEVRLTSTGAGAFYIWCRNIINEVQRNKQALQ
ncbi:uncharacterized protein [Haliotis asinina]|uniref:uncharacterized protein n=1 Tax=Haliotis asinina TaxID=109174 RepID=UPI003531E7E2